MLLGFLRSSIGDEELIFPEVVEFNITNIEKNVQEGSNASTNSVCIGHW